MTPDEWHAWAVACIGLAALALNLWAWLDAEGYR